MSEHCDILIVGAGTAGVYFGWQMARQGHSVVIVVVEEERVLELKFYLRDEEKLA